MNVVLFDAGNLDMDRVASFLLPDVHLHRRGFGMRAEIDRTNKETAEKIIEGITSNQAVHNIFLSFRN